MGRTGVERAQSSPAGWAAAGTATAYAAAIVAFAYALVSLYWAVGGHGLVSTVGGYVTQFAREGGAVPVLVALAASAAKVGGGLLALSLVRPWGRVVPRRWLLIASTGASALLVGYGGLNVAVGGLVLSEVIHPSGRVDRTALRWHVGAWDLWFLVWGVFLALAAAGYWRRTSDRPRLTPQTPRPRRPDPPDDQLRTGPRPTAPIATATASDPTPGSTGPPSATPARQCRRQAQPTTPPTPAAASGRPLKAPPRGRVSRRAQPSLDRRLAAENLSSCCRQSGCPGCSTMRKVSEQTLSASL